MAYRLCVGERADARAHARLARIAERLFMLPDEVIKLRLAWAPPWLVQVESFEQAQRLCDLIARAARVDLEIHPAKGGAEPCDSAIERLEAHLGQLKDPFAAAESTPPPNPRVTVTRTPAPSVPPRVAPVATPPPRVMATPSAPPRVMATPTAPPRVIPTTNSPPPRVSHHSNGLGPPPGTPPAAGSGLSSPINRHEVQTSASERAAFQMDGVTPEPEPVTLDHRSFSELEVLELDYTPRSTAPPAARPETGEHQF